MTGQKENFLEQYKIRILKTRLFTHSLQKDYNLLFNTE